MPPVENPPTQPLPQPPITPEQKPHTFRYILLAMVIIFVVFPVTIALIGLGFFAARSKSATQSLKYCSNVSNLTNQHIAKLTTTYKISSTVYVANDKGCSLKQPGVTYNFYGKYKPGEAPEVMTNNIVNALSADGWKFDPAQKTQGASQVASLQTESGVLKAKLRYQETEIYTRPEAFTIDFEGDENISKATLPEASEIKLTKEILWLTYQVSLYYPNPMPSGLQLIDKDKFSNGVPKVISLSFYDYQISDSKGNQSRVELRVPKPSATNPCDITDFTSTPTCLKVANSAGGSPIYKTYPDSRNLPEDVGYVVTIGDTVVSVKRAVRDKQSISYPDILRVINSMQMENSQRLSL